MPERIANTFVVVEDREQQNLVRRYLQRCWGSNYSERKIDWRPLPAGQGSGEQHVRREYAKQVRACRSSLGERNSSLLITVVDADTDTTSRRTTQLAAALEAADLPPRKPGEPIAVLIPKRHVETWIRALLGKEVDEEANYTKAPYSFVPTRNDIKNAANELHAWTRPRAEPGPTSSPSLTESIPEWRRIPS